MLLRLRIQNGSLTGQEFVLQEGALTLGRAGDCNLIFSANADPGVSNYHAVLVAHPDGYYIADQQSTNGTFVNGQTVERAWLNSGDTIRLGYEGPEIRVTVENGSRPEVPSTVIQTPQQQASEQAPLTIAGLRNTFSSLSYYDPQRDRPSTSRWMGIGAAVGIAGIMSLIVFIILTSTIGFTGTLVGSIIAFIPAPFYLFIYLWMDRYDPEPGWALGTAFAWGALFAVIVSFVINTLFGSVAAAVMGDEAGGTLAGVISAPIIEEGTKGAGVVLIMLLLRKEFDGILDGIVYAGVIALGFATVENVLYYGRSFVQEGVFALVFTTFIRGILSPFAHATFTSMTGIGCGISRESTKPGVRFIMPIVGYCGAMFLHSLWNFCASLLGGAFFIAYVIFWVPLFLVFLIVIFTMAGRERKIIRNVLQVEVATGFLSAPEVELAGSIGQRMKWILSAKGDRAKFNARRHFLRAMTKLAFCYWHAERANAAGIQTISLPQIPKFRAEIKNLRFQI